MARKQQKVIISCAVTGSVHTPTMSPALPVTPDEIAQASLDRIKPVVEKVRGSAGGRLERIKLRGTVRHGVVSVPALERRLIRG